MGETGIRCPTTEQLRGGGVLKFSCRKGANLLVLVSLGVRIQILTVSLHEQKKSGGIICLLHPQDLRDCT